MTLDRSHRRLPPYISYRTFENFIGRLQPQVPSRIDRSYWGETLSGSTGTQLMAALRFLNLVDANGMPTGQLKLIAASKGEQRTQALKEITWDAYDFVLRSSLDIQAATYAQLEEVFHANFQLAPDVCRKCIKFFVSLAAAAGTALSPFVTKRVRMAHSGTGTISNRIVQKRVVPNTARNLLVPNVSDAALLEPQAVSVHAQLLAKFPSFDPTWSDELKSKWFTAYDELLKRYPARS